MEKSGEFLEWCLTLLKKDECYSCNIVLKYLLLFVMLICLIKHNSSHFFGIKLEMCYLLRIKTNHNQFMGFAIFLFESSLRSLEIVFNFPLSSKVELFFS